MQMAVTETPRPLAELTALQRDVLAQLNQMDDPIVRDVADALGESYGDEVVYATVANALAALQQMGLVEGDRDGRKKNYRLTDAGERELRNDINWRQA